MEAGSRVILLYSGETIGEMLLVVTWEVENVPKEFVDLAEEI